MATALLPTPVATKERGSRRSTATGAQLLVHARPVEKSGEYTPLDPTAPSTRINNRRYLGNKYRLLDYLRSEKVGLRSVKYLEPSAGRGAFLNLMPPSLRIGLDIMPQTDETICADFLSWEPEPRGIPIVVIGNPPFGYRGWLALEFLNHAATFADYVGFILPMAFQSAPPTLEVR
jgi:hypothetical protein